MGISGKLDSGQRSGKGSLPGSEQKCVRVALQRPELSKEIRFEGRTGVEPSPTAGKTKGSSQVTTVPVSSMRTCSVPSYTGAST